MPDNAWDVTWYKWQRPDFREWLAKQYGQVPGYSLWCEEQYGVEQDDEPVVCTIHRCFIPCRHGREGTECVYSSEPEDVYAVRRFQNGET